MLFWSIPICTERFCSSFVIFIAEIRRVTNNVAGVYTSIYRLSETIRWLEKPQWFRVQIGPNQLKNYFSPKLSKMVFLDIWWPREHHETKWAHKNQLCMLCACSMHTPWMQFFKGLWPYIYHTYGTLLT